LIGWVGDELYFQVTGCPGQPGDECYGELVGQTIYRVSRSEITETEKPPGLVLMNRYRTESEYLSLSQESFGVSIRRSMSGEALPLLRFSPNHALVAAGS